jgi:hypothetical protein
MMQGSTDITRVTFSVRVYRLLLNAYPAKFQKEYGSHMAQVFQDSCLRVMRQGGKAGMARLWMATLLDLIQSVISEHARREIQMKKEMKPEDIRKAGWVLMLATPAFILGVFWETSVYDLWIIGFPLLLISVFMLAYGLRGIQARYGESVGSFGRSILQAGAILGPVITLVGFIGAFIVPWLFILVYTGPAVLLACLLIFGAMALLRKPFMNWKALAVFAAIWYPAFFFNDQIGGFIRGEWITFTFNSPDLFIMAVPGIAMIVLGYILQADSSQEMTPA